jgi:hypothetical protein
MGLRLAHELQITQCPIFLETNVNFNPVLTSRQKCYTSVKYKNLNVGLNALNSKMYHLKG